MGNSALSSFKGYHYQQLVALLECFKMREGDSVYIELDGDVSVCRRDGQNKQIETKYVKKGLSDSAEEFWKTLKNWSADDFDYTKYTELILLTTQLYGARTQLKNWNEKNADERVEIVDELLKKKQTQNEYQLKVNKVLNDEPQKLKTILFKIKILDEQRGIDGIKNEIKELYLKGIPYLNRACPKFCVSV